MQRKREKSLLSFTKNKLLHSKNSKSTYFYRRWFQAFWPPSKRKVCGTFLRKSSLAAAFGRLRKRIFSHCPRQFNRQRPVRFRSEKCDFQNETNNNLLIEQDKLHSKTGKSTYFYSGGRLNLSSDVYGYGKTGFLKSYFLPITCAMTLLLVLGLAINPMVSGDEEKVHAAYEPVTSTTGVSLLMETDDKLAQETQTVAGTTAYRYNRFKVNKGTDIDKYQVLVQAANGYDSTLVGAKNGQIVNAVSGATKGSAMDSAWGYSLAEGAITNTDSLANLEYQALPGGGSTNTNATPYTETKEFTLAFAANIKDKPADHYQTSVLLSVAAGAGEVVELPTWTIHNMQDMNPAICTNAEEGTTGQLTDLRDGKTYWVAKLKDGKCWMTQNLALDLDVTKPLTSAFSDVSSDWTPTATTQYSTITRFPSDSDRTFSYNPGEYVYTTPMERNSCGASGISKLEGCPNWKLVTGLNKDASGNEQAHYLAGNYYSYEVATAGSAPASGGASSSICPKGWRLPNTDNYTNLTNGLTASITDTANNIKLAPYYFVYGGYVFSSTLNAAGSYGRYWSSTANDSNNAYVLLFTTNVNPSSTLARYYGYSVRCVAR